MTYGIGIYKTVLFVLQETDEPIPLKEISKRSGYSTQQVSSVMLKYKDVAGFIRLGSPSHYLSMEHKGETGYLYQILTPSDDEDAIDLKKRVEAKRRSMESKFFVPDDLLGIWSKPK